MNNGWLVAEEMAVSGNGEVAGVVVRRASRFPPRRRRGNNGDTRRTARQNGCLAFNRDARLRMGLASLAPATNH